VYPWTRMRSGRQAAFRVWMEQLHLPTNAFERDEIRSVPGGASDPVERTALARRKCTFPRS
jgi:hypothetical protein